MDILKLKVTVGDATIDLEGDSQMVYTIFTELREGGLGKLSYTNKLSDRNHLPNIKKPEISRESKEQIEPQQDDAEFIWPTIHNIVLQGLPQKESEWLLVYSCFASEQGKKTFNEEDLRGLYKQTERYTDSNRKNFKTNVKKLASSGYISAINDNSYRLEQAGLKETIKILSKNGNDQPAKRFKKINRKATTSYTSVDMNLSEEERQDFRSYWEAYSTNGETLMDKAVLVAYWLKLKKSISEISPNHLFTMLKIADEKTGFDLAATLRNAKNQKEYFLLGAEPKHYSLSHIGEDHAKFDLTKS